MAPGFGGPRPPVARWPKAEKKFSSAHPVEFAPHQRRAERTGRWQAGQEQLSSPDAVRQEARERVVKLQRALEVLGQFAVCFGEGQETFIGAWNARAGREASG